MSFSGPVPLAPVLCCVLRDLPFSHSHVSPSIEKALCGASRALLKEVKPERGDEEKVAALSTRLCNAVKTLLSISSTVRKKVFIFRFSPWCKITPVYNYVNS